MENSITQKDERYSELFDVSKEAEHFGNAVDGDQILAVCHLRDAGGVQKGTLRELMGIPERMSMFDVERDSYALLSFASCERAFRDNQLFSSHAYRESPGARTLGASILGMIGDEHKRHRASVQPMFIKPRATGWWHDNWIQEIVDQLLDTLKGTTRTDLNYDLCARLPMHTVTRGIGLQGEEALTFRDHLTKATGVRGVTPSEQSQSNDIVEQMLRNLIQARRAKLDDDVVSKLIERDFMTTDGTTRKLTDDQIMAHCRVILLAGGGTTWRQLGITIVTLLQNYPFWQACREDRSLIPQALEEVIRWSPNIGVFPRLATQDVELEGVLIPAGSRVEVTVASANRDPARWDNPDAFDIFRKPQPHLSFAVGAHQCLGINVARQEMITALNGLMDRFPDMRLDPDAEPPVISGALEQRGMSSVPVILQ